MDRDLSRALDAACSGDILTLEEDLELGRRMVEGDQAARERLVASCMRLAVQIGMRFAGRGVGEAADLVQEGMLGLVEAVDRYDYRKGRRLCTYAYWRIYMRVRRAAEKAHASVRSSGVYSLDLPAPPELIASLDQPLREALSEYGEEATRLGDMVPDEDATDPHEEADATCRSDRLRELMERLTPRERQAMELWSGGHRTMEEVAKLMGVTRQRIAQLVEKATWRLKVWTRQKT